MLKNKKFLIAGAGGQLAKEFQRAALRQHLNLIAPPEGDFNITDKKQIENTFKKIKPDIVINGAAYNLVDEAEGSGAPAFAVNAQAVESLALACRDHKAFFVHYSTDYVFDGKKGSPYIEEDRVNPLNVYGTSKLKGEEAIGAHLKDFLIFRLSWLFGSGKQNFLYKLYQWAQKNETLKISNDEISVPTYTEDVVRATFLSLEKGLRGLYHLTNSGYCSRFELAKYFFMKMGLNNTLEGVPMGDFKLKARRPLFSAMSNAKIIKNLNQTIPTWQDAVDRFAADFKKQL